MKRNSLIPPRYATKILLRFLRDDLAEEVTGDLEERFYAMVGKKSYLRAQLNYWYEVFNYLRPFAIRRSSLHAIKNYDMFRSYFKVGLRSLLRNKGYSFINIGGLALGMAVAILIGLWTYDELSYDKYYDNYDNIVQVMQHQVLDGHISSQVSIPIPLAAAMREAYGNNFTYLSLSSWTGEHILSSGEHKISQNGSYVEASFPHMLALKMKAGTQDGLKDPASIMLSASAAKALFGSADALGQSLRIDSKLDVKVTGVYEDMPVNSTFHDLAFISSWDLYLTSESWLKTAQEQWGNNSFQLFGQILPTTNITALSEKIKKIKYDLAEKQREFKSEIFLNPMSNWHLHDGWDNGKNIGGRIQMVWLFSIIGIFVLLLACINFMNLSTARSEKRAKEVGIRMTIGCVRSQLIKQFLTESFLVVALAFMVALLIVLLALPSFNTIADKRIMIPWSDPLLWLISVVFIIITSLLAGSYPALFLSSFNPVKVLKGSFKTGRLASLPRKVLVVVQFAVSITLIIGTMVVYQQILYSKNRQVGYDREGLLQIQMKSPDFYGKYGVLQTELKNTGVVAEMSESSSPISSIWQNGSGFSWEGKQPGAELSDFGTIFVTPEYGKTLNWKIKEGRDFTIGSMADSTSVLVNEAAVKFMGIKEPLGMMIHWEHKKFYVIGVVEDMIMESPYEPIRHNIYFMDYDNVNWINIRLTPGKNIQESLAAVEAVFIRNIPSAPFDYRFADEEYAKKFSDEERIGKLSYVFAGLAVFISCLGLLGLASFVAEQRTKEVGIRKVMGASIISLWKMLSTDFILLVAVSFTIAAPVSYYFMSNWLAKYEYHTDISWKVFVFSGMGALILTLATVSFQAVKAAVMNPVKSLRSE